MGYLLVRAEYIWPADQVWSAAFLYKTMLQEVSDPATATAEKSTGENVVVKISIPAILLYLHHFIVYQRDLGMF